MADVKISQLPVATTPLTGTEEVPLVQSGATKQTTIADIVSKVGAVTAVTGTAPVVSSGGLTPAISMAAATSSVNGYLTSTDWTTFNAKQPAGSYLVNGGPLGTPSSGTATNLTGTASGLTAGNVTTNANLTGAVTSVGNATSLGSFTSAQLATALTDETGSGASVFATSPTLVTPILGTPTSGNFSTGTFTWPTFNQNTTGTAANVTGTVAIANGGTGQTTANAAFNALAPSQTSQSGKYLTTDGTNTSWATNPLGTVTSVAATVPSFLSITGSPITTSGTLAFGLSGTALPTTSGGTGLTSFTANGVVYASSTSALATGSALTFDGSTFGVGAKLQVNAPSNYRYSDFNTTSAAYGFSSFSYNGTAYGYIGQASAFFSGGSNTDLALSAANSLVFGANNAEAMRLTSTGLGIGTSSPAYKLDVNIASGSVRVRSNTATANSAGYLLGNSYRAWSILSESSAGNFIITDETTAGTPTRLTIDSSGNFGIGTSSPAKKLDVNGDALIYGITVGRGAGAVSTNTAVGASALAATATGGLNTALGFESGNAITSGTNNTLLGFRAGKAVTTASGNAVLGDNG